MMDINLQDPQTNLIEKMTYRSEVPFYAERVNDDFVIAVCQGKLSEYDIKIKYCQIENNEWSPVRTPKHIHWVVDVLLKMKGNKKLTQRFIDKLLEMGNTIEAITTSKQRTEWLNIDYLLHDYEEYKEFQALDKYGEYPIKFLLVLIKLLLIQEKTNHQNENMFRGCLETLKNPNNSIFRIISKATYRGSK